MMLYCIRTEFFIELHYADDNGVDVSTHKSYINPDKDALTDKQAVKIIDDKEVKHVIGIQNDELYEKMGLQIFNTYVTLHKESVEPMTICRGFLVGKNGFCEIPEYLFDTLICDIDDDGALDLVCISYGPTSGICSYSIYVYSEADSLPFEKYSTVITPIYYDIESEKLELSNGKVNVLLSDYKYILSIKDGKLAAEKTEDGE